MPKSKQRKGYFIFCSHGPEKNICIYALVIMKMVKGENLRTGISSLIS